MLNRHYESFARLDKNMIERVKALHELRAYFEIFLERSADTNWKATRDRAKQALVLIYIIG